jgi:sigma-B regulation protein RsbU (phosphoserine phosphatase)
MEDATYESGERVLARGDWLAIFTDGVVEAENVQQQEYGEMRFIAQLQAGALAPPSMLLSNILLDLDHFVGNAPQHDDVTCVLMRAV